MKNLVFVFLLKKTKTRFFIFSRFASAHHPLSVLSDMILKYLENNVFEILHFHKWCPIGIYHVLSRSRPS